MHDSVCSPDMVNNPVQNTGDYDDWINSDLPLVVYN